MKVDNQKLTPSAGMLLTQAADIAIASRIVTDCVHLAVNDSAENWREISPEEADAIRAAQESTIKTGEEVQP